MTIRFLFDENIAPVIVENLSTALKPIHSDLEMLDMRSFLKTIGDEIQGVWDEVWFPKAVDQGWTVIAADRGSKGGIKKGRKLPELCASAGVIHFLLSPRVHQRKVECKYLTILSVWSDVVFSMKSDSEIRFVIEPASSKPEHKCKGKLTKRKIYKPETPPDGKLF